MPSLTFVRVPDSMSTSDTSERWATDGPLHRVRRPVDRVGQPLMAQRHHALCELVAKLHELRPVDVPRRQRVSLTIVSRVDLLPRHDVDVAGMPDFHGCLFVRSFAASLSAGFSPGLSPLSPSFGFAAPGTSRSSARCRRRSCGHRRTTRDADTRRCAILPGRRRFEGIEQRDRAQLPPRQNRMGGAIVVVIGCPAEDRQVVGFLAPRQACVDGGGGIEHAQRSALGIEELDAIAGLVVGADRERQQLALVLPHELGHVAECRVAACCQLADDERCPCRARLRAGCSG